jgi:hypothetical protein
VSGTEPHAEGAGQLEHTRFVGMDLQQEKTSIAVAESGRGGALSGEIANDPGAIGTLCARLGASPEAAGVL